ncbi:protein Bouncer-like [Mugil cephalus]|uniref:protein Bouncer-like n=1 Tax=Mugil cephalus TaxID=48193 RepID=UPI001FB6B38C|nr:protein Bouncer-like [Mugil cephalus]
MGSQRQNSVSGPRRFLTSAPLVMALLFPAVTLDSLLCYHCPLQRKGQPCPNVTSQCLPHQRCSSSRGRYGSVHVLSARGCVDSDLCGSHQILSYRGTEYNVSHGCCCEDKCNGAPKLDGNLKMLLGVVSEKTDSVNNVLREETRDSCANYTSSTTAASPATRA